jgi:hypothetical protein
MYLYTRTKLHSANEAVAQQWLVEETGYGRKANAIHRWFVENVQNGVDDCNVYEVSRRQLEQLLDVVERVLAASELIDGSVHNGDQLNDGQWVPMLERGKVVKDPSVAMALLTTQPGFFFGSTDYDQGYVEDLRETRRILTEALAGDADWFEYSSSW